MGHRRSRIVLQHQPAESPTALQQPVQDLRVCSRVGVWLWAVGVLPLSAAWERKGGASNTGPCSTYAPSPEQLATILGSLICCDLSSQNICLKKDQIFIAHLCILLKGEMRLVMVDKCQSMCEESTCEEKKGRERKGEKEHFFQPAVFNLLCLLSFGLGSGAESSMAITMQYRAALLTQSCHWMLLVCILIILLIFRIDSGKLFPSKKPLN